MKGREKERGILTVLPAVLTVLPAVLTVLTVLTVV